MNLLSGLMPLRQPAECLVEIGTPPLGIGALHDALVDVAVDTARSEAATAVLTFQMRRDEFGRWPVTDSGRLLPWAPVRISAVFGPSRREEIMRGFIRTVRASYPSAQGEARFVVECQDASIALDREHMRRPWGEQAGTTDAVVLATILQKYGLVPEPGCGTGQAGVTLHQDATDIAFLRERAAANGYELSFRQGRVYFGPWRVSAPRQPTIMVYAGRDSHCLRLDVHSDGHLPDVAVVDQAAPTGSGVTTIRGTPTLALLGKTAASASAPGEREMAWRMQRRGTGSHEQVQALVTARANEAAFRIRAEGDLDGSRYGHVLSPGLPVRVDGIGDLLSGTYYVDKVTHRLSGSGYQQAFVLLRNAFGDDNGAVAHVLSAVTDGALAGLGIGV